MGNEDGRGTGDGKENKCVCEVCGKQFDDESELRKHVYEVGLVE